MPYKDLREFIKRLDDAGELVRITDPVRAELEITAISDRMMKSKDGGKAILFEKVIRIGDNDPCGIPVLVNMYGSRKRMAWALGVENIEEIPARIRSFIKPEIPSGIVDTIKRIPQLMELTKFPPKNVSAGSCQEVVMDPPDLSKLPVCKCWPKDGGAFFTLPQIITRDLKDGVRNVGMYRMQVYDKTSTGMHWHIHHGGSGHLQKYIDEKRRMEVAVALGGDPALGYSASAPLPEGIDEYLFAGFIRKKPVELVKCKTIDLQVPADAEIVLEGYVDPTEKKIEGPFGDHTGFYSLQDEYPVFHVTAITHRKDPIYPHTIVGIPPMEDFYMGWATERIFLPLIQIVLPEIIDYSLPAEGIFHNFVFVRIKKRYPGHAFKVMNAIWGLGQLMFSKYIIVVDEWVDVQNLSQVLWVLGNQCEPDRDTLLSKGPRDALDHSTPLAHFGSKMGFDATEKWPEEGHTRPWPDRIAMDETVINSVKGYLDKLGIG
ncbi:MAG: menaquinone biosynthesis decarboxylase [bacterium]|nr:menaquinone biosynthesis decarboxylase [bacterium]